MDGNARIQRSNKSWKCIRIANCGISKRWKRNKVKWKLEMPKFSVCIRNRITFEYISLYTHMYILYAMHAGRSLSLPIVYVCHFWPKANQISVCPPVFFNLTSYSMSIAYIRLWVAASCYILSWNGFITSVFGNGATLTLSISAIDAIFSSIESFYSIINVNLWNLPLMT